MKENPEFFKAFPHLQPAVYDSLNPNIAEEFKGKAFEPTDYIRSQDFFDKNDLKSQSSKNDDYFQSLLHQQNKYLSLKPKEKEDMIRENEMNFVSAYQGVDGPFKYMSEQAKEKVHQILDIRLQELEDTGLTRMEILHEKQVGLKLADDLFFQMIKLSRTAREMLLKPGDEFTADRIIELALRQDTGPDPSLSMIKEDFRMRDWQQNEQPNWEYKKKYRDTTPIIGPEAYFANENYIQRRKRFYEFDQEKPATFINRPLSRNQIRMKLVRPIRKSDIDYYNTPLMTKFLNDVGKLHNRYQTRLHTNVQRKVARVVKKMRSQFILPYVGVIKPTDKIALGSYIEEIEEMHKKTIDPITGRLFLKYSLQDDLEVKLKRERERMEKRFGHIETQQELQKIEKEAEQQYKIIREMSVDNDQILPDQKTRLWMVAQTHLMFQEGKDKLKQQESELNNKLAETPYDQEDFILPSEQDRERAKEAYDFIMKEINKKDLNSDSIFEDFISEKAYNIQQKEKNVVDELIELANKDLRQ